MKLQRTEIIISGIGGQGVVYSANLLSRAALYQHKFSSSIAHYGPESRGSVTTSEIVISNPTTPLIPLNKGGTLTGRASLKLAPLGVKGGYSPFPDGTTSLMLAPLGVTKGEKGCLDYPCVESPDIFIAMHQKGYDYHITNHKLVGAVHEPPEHNGAIRELPLQQKRHMNVFNLKYLIYDSTLVTIPKITMPHIENLNLIAIPASQLAKEELKNIMMANIILTASVVKATKIVTRENLERALKQMAPPKDYQLNLQAIELGYLGV